MVRTVLLTEHDLVGWGRAYEAEQRPTRLPYGVDALEKRGYVFRAPRMGQRPVEARLRAVLEHRAGFPIEATVRATRAVRGADLILALLEQQGRAAAKAKRYGFPPFRSTPLVLWSVWLADELSRRPHSDRVGFARDYLSANLVVHQSNTETDVLLSAGFRADQIFANSWGVASDYYSPGDATRDLDLLAVGQDRGRDYGTLFDALSGTDLRLDLVCRPVNLQGLDIPPNVTMRGTVSHTEYRSLLRRAKVVVVPTKEMMYPTGSSVALEAASCGACVVVTGTPSMRQFFTDREDSLLVDAGDPETLRSALLEAARDPGLRARLGSAARILIETRFNAVSMWNEIDDVLHARGILAPT